MESNALSLEEFKARLPIADIVGRYVRLVRHGREFTGLCPFHQEKNTVVYGFSRKRVLSLLRVQPARQCSGFHHGGRGVGVRPGDCAPCGSDRSTVTGALRQKNHGGGKELYHANEAAARWFSGCLSGPSGKKHGPTSKGAGGARCDQPLRLGLCALGPASLEARLNRREFQRRAIGQSRPPDPAG